MKTLYIVGNGFDMAHKLPTSYWHFREYLEDMHQDFLADFEYLYNIGRIDLSNPRVSERTVSRWKKAICDTLWSDFEDKMGRPNIDEMLDASDCVLGDMHLDGGLIGIEDTMDVYWREQYGYMEKFQQYVKDWIEQVDTSSVSPKCNRILNSTDYFMNFNYTYLLEKVYHAENVLHIHGGVESVTDIEPVMGHCNKHDIDEHKRLAREADEEFDEGGASIHRAVVDYLSRIYKDTDAIVSFNNYFWNKLHNVNRVEIIGWSAGEVDLPYLRIIRDNVDSSTIWNVYFYDDRALTMLSKAMDSEKISDLYEVHYIPANEFWNK